MSSDDLAMFSKQVSTIKIDEQLQAQTHEVKVRRDCIMNRENVFVPVLSVDATGDKHCILWACFKRSTTYEPGSNTIML